MNLLSAAEAALLGVPIGLALGLVGGGGSILTVPILVGLLGLSPRLATGASLLIVAANAGNALRGYTGQTLLQRGVARRLVQYRLAGLLVVGGLAGTALGTLLSSRLEARALTLTFVGLMVLVALNMLRGARAVSGDCPESPGRRPLPRVLAVGSLVGLTTGFFGVGGGFVIVPALLYLGLCMRQAVPTSLLVIVLNSLLALGLRAWAGAEVPLGYALPMVLGGLAGSALAVRLAPRLGNAGLNRAFALLVLVLAAGLGWTATRA